MRVKYQPRRSTICWDIFVVECFHEFRKLYTTREHYTRGSFGKASIY